jgi:hypothetical protein
MKQQRGHDYDDNDLSRSELECEDTRRAWLADLLLCPEPSLPNPVR